MGWSIGYDSNWCRDIGYGVPARCDHPDCNKDIDRGLSYVCGSDPYGGEFGCGLYFCSDHMTIVEKDGQLIQLCERCAADKEPFDKKADAEEWIEHKRTHPSWAEWRKEQSKSKEKENE